MLAAPERLWTWKEHFSCREVLAAVWKEWDSALKVCAELFMAGYCCAAWELHEEVLAAVRRHQDLAPQVQEKCALQAASVVLGSEAGVRRREALSAVRRGKT